MKARWLLIAALSSCAFGQGVFYSSSATQTASNVPPGSAGPVYTVPNALVTVCSYPAIGDPCTNQVDIFTDQDLVHKITQPLQADQFGRYSFWVAPGIYSQSIQTQSGVSKGTYPLSLDSPQGPQGPAGAGCGAGSSQCIIGSPTISQTITQPGGTNFNVITSVSGAMEHNGSPLVDSVPAGNQLISQPSGTTLSVSSLNAVLNAAMFPGADIGEKINTAIASLPSGCGKVLVPSSPTPYSFSTSIHLHRCTVLVGSSGLSSVLNWTPTTGVAIYISDADGSSIYPGGYISDIYLKGPSQSTGTSVGLYFGGDPSCTSGCTTNPSTNFGDNYSVYNSKISFFQTGILFGNHAFLDDFYSDQISNNGTGVQFPGNVSDSGEAISFFGTKFINSTNQGLNLMGFGDFFFYGSACDYNLGGCLFLVGSQAHFYGMHFEQGNGAFIQVGSTADPRMMLDIQGSTFTSTITSGGPDAGFIVVSDPASLSLRMNGTLVLASHPYTNFLVWNPTGFQDKFSNSLDLTGNTGLFGNANIANVMSSSCNDGTSFLQTCVIRRAIFSSNISLSSVGANSCSSQDIVMPGYSTLDIPVSMTKETRQPGLIIAGIQTNPSTDHPGITICNITASPITPTAGDLYTLIVQR